MKCPTVSSFKVGKNVLCYLKGTSNHGIVFRKDENSNLIGYSDAYEGQELPIEKSISGYLFFFSGGPILWRSKQHSLVSQSTVEAEYIAL